VSLRTQEEQEGTKRQVESAISEGQVRQRGWQLPALSFAVFEIAKNVESAWMRARLTASQSAK
jgi:hypothetical protein